MNERIKELTDKIWAEKYWDHPNADKHLPFHLNKFAKLIVQECQTIIKETYQETDPAHRECLITATLKIEQHFGVKE